VPLRYVDLVVDVPAVGDRRFTYSVPYGVVLPTGAKVRVPFGKGEADGFVAGQPESPPTMQIKPVKAVYDPEFMPDGDLLALASEMASHYCSPLSSTWSCLWPPVAPKREPERPATDMTSRQTAQLPRLESPQAGGPARSTLVRGGREFRWRAYLDKTHEARSEGRGVLVLVPEVKGIEEAFSRLEADFPGEVAKIHSEQTGVARRAAYLSLIRDEKPIALGTRSAVFAPVKRLGLIVLEDEPAEPYKSPELPFYDSRTVAAMRGRLQACQVVLGSSHPSVESHWGVSTGTLRLVPEAAEEEARGSEEDALPSAVLVNMREVRRSRDILSQPLRDRLGETFSQGGRAILFLNRRGDSSQVTCQDCGNTLMCPRCGVPLGYHSKEAVLICHTCGYSQLPPELCPSCAGHRWKFAGFGIERADSELRKIFPGVPVFRIDRDSSKEQPAVSALRGFAAAGPACLLATRMVLGFPDVPKARTVGVLSCDTLLNLPDYRASEKVFHLMWSLRELALPASSGGSFIAQTYNPDHHGVRGILDPEAFYREELDNRRLLGYPPFRQFVKIHFSGRSLDRVRDAAGRFAAAAIMAGEPVDVLGPGPAPKPKARGEHRWQAALRGRDQVRTISLCRQAVLAAGQAGVRVSVDVDPVDMA